MAIGLFGGSFNPIHLGHLALAREVQSRCHLDKVIFLPSGDPPHKNSAMMAAAQHRYIMTTLATEPYPDFETSAYETDKNDISYSIDTVRYFRAQFGQETGLYFAMGIDAFLELDTWKDYHLLLSYCHLVVTTRSEFDWAEMDQITFLQRTEKTCFYSLEQILPVVNQSGGTIFGLEIPDFAISSSNLRDRISRGYPIDHLCPQSVTQYITNQNLYREGD
ncbi:nicotinate-nucleotide adenylyltransferase [candidate division CSSED10-310 bacterium]|uniref:Probable nicotinate-nucleotide adenylyltransferase n=1 Tax=candidate division CSSED10-310 bacterium TaxID=2855610 RepID=A0ABV6YSL1_UNCC1